MCFIPQRPMAPFTLNARIPFPEEATKDTPLTVVFPHATNAKLYEVFRNVPAGKPKKLNAKEGVTIVVETTHENPDASERMNAALRVLTHVTIVRNATGELLLHSFPIDDGNRMHFGEESVRSIVQELSGPAAPPPATSETVVGGTGDTKTHQRVPGKARQMTAEERARMNGGRITGADAANAASAAIDRRFKPRG